MEIMIERKKSKNANLESKRRLFFQIGLFFTIGLIIFIFEIETKTSEKNIQIIDINIHNSKLKNGDNSEETIFRKLKKNKFQNI